MWTRTKLPTGKFVYEMTGSDGTAWKIQRSHTGAWQLLKDGKLRLTSRTLAATKDFAERS